MKRILLSVLILIGIFVGVVLYQNMQPTRPDTDEEVRSDYFLDSTPLHNDIYAAPPVNITLNFAVKVSDQSTIRVVNTSNPSFIYEEWQTGAVVVTNNDTSLQQPLKPDLPDGLYVATYNACLPDSSCHDGQFSFSIDSSRQNEYVDRRNEREVVIDMQNVQFEPKKVIISPYTTVRWINLERDVHFVNTETHPAHSYYPEQNSRGINKDESFITTFTTPGQYDYHCSAHVPQGMRGSIIVKS